GAWRREPGGPLPRPGRRQHRRGGPGVVAHLLRLKLDLLRNGLRRSTAAIVGMVVGVLYGGGFVVAGRAGMVTLRAQGDVDLARTAVVVAGSAVVAGWAL